MTSWHHGWPPSQPPSPPHGLETENRLTKLESSRDSHDKRITILERVLWGLIASVAGMAHEKLPRLLDWVEMLLRLRP